MTRFPGTGRESLLHTRSGPHSRLLQPHVQILLCTRNGARHLGAQLASFVAQEHGDWSLWVGDDGSTDATLDILKDFARAHPGHGVHVVTGPGRGAAANFLSLLGHPERPPGPVAFADQDDVWMPHKLARALDWLAGPKAALPKAALSDGPLSDGAGPEFTGPESDPATPPGRVYICRTRHTDADLRPAGLSTLHPHPPAFANALVQNILGGNTIVADATGADLLRRTVPAALAADVPFHDWWVYLAASGAGLPILSDPEPGLWYRQHGANLLGANRGLRGLSRLAMIGDGRYRDWIGRNLAALGAIAPLLLPGNRDLAARFAAWRDEPPRQRVPLAGLGIWRQSRSGDRLLQIAARRGRL